MMERKDSYGLWRPMCELARERQALDSETVQQVLTGLAEMTSNPTLERRPLPWVGPRPADVRLVYIEEPSRTERGDEEFRVRLILPGMVAAVRFELTYATPLKVVWEIRKAIGCSVRMDVGRQHVTVRCASPCGETFDEAFQFNCKNEDFRSAVEALSCLWDDAS